MNVNVYVLQYYYNKYGYKININLKIIMVLLIYKALNLIFGEMSNYRETYD